MAFCCLGVNIFYILHCLSSFKLYFVVSVQVHKFNKKFPLKAAVFWLDKLISEVHAETGFSNKSGRMVSSGLLTRSDSVLLVFTKKVNLTR